MVCAREKQFAYELTNLHDELVSALEYIQVELTRFRAARCYFVHRVHFRLHETKPNTVLQKNNFVGKYLCSRTQNKQTYYVKQKSYSLLMIFNTNHRCETVAMLSYAAGPTLGRPQGILDGSIFKGCGVCPLALRVYTDATFQCLDTRSMQRYTFVLDMNTWVHFECLFSTNSLQYILVTVDQNSFK